MLFNSIDFAIFLPIVFFLYWFVTSKNLKLQNFLIIIASYFFYGLWSWKFLILIIFSTLVDFTIGNLLSKEENQTKRKALLWCSIIVNLGFLLFFKYYNFFVENFVETFALFGKKLEIRTLKIILPVGISFYTFQTLSYTIDVYRRKLEPTKNLTAFAAFVCFFPQLVAGPIERATHLLPQFFKKRTFNYSLAIDGTRQILWGLFKKVVIADSSAVYANEIFNNSDNLNGSTLLIGALFFTFQIYGDFSGYSDIAIGTSRLFGFDLMQNFSFPYFSRDIAEFWRRWHISLSTWFRDYLYIPLGGSKGGTSMKIRNTFIIFLVSGFWHGANWTFIFWGLLNAIYFLPLLLTKRNRNNLEIVAKDRILPTFKEFISINITFLLTVLAWIFFRSDSMKQAFSIIREIFSSSLFSLPMLQDSLMAIITFLLILFMLIIEWNARDKKFALQNFEMKWPLYLRCSFYYIIIIMIFIFGGQEQDFIYFQF